MTHVQFRYSRTSIMDAKMKRIFTRPQSSVENKQSTANMCNRMAKRPSSVPASKILARKTAFSEHYATIYSRKTQISENNASYSRKTEKLENCMINNDRKTAFSENSAPSNGVSGSASDSRKLANSGNRAIKNDRKIAFAENISPSNDVLGESDSRKAANAENCPINDDRKITFPEKIVPENCSDRKQRSCSSISVRKRAVSATSVKTKQNSVTFVIDREELNEINFRYFNGNRNTYVSFKPLPDGKILRLIQIQRCCADDNFNYNSNDLLEEMYPTGGALTPLVQAREQSPAMGRYSPNKGARVTPLDGLHNNGRPGRPKSRVRPLGRPQSRVDVSVQFEDKKDKMTEKKSYPPPEPEQYNYAIPDMMARPTSPVQRLLERGQSQPFMSVQGGHVPGTQMDPITRQYYHRQWSKQRPTSSTDLSLNRYGRAGGQWRHIRACVANTGSQLAFIDGTVKEEDNVYFPQFGKRSLALSSTMPTYPAQLYAQHPGMMPKYNTMASRPSYRSKFSDHAKSGFKYWYQEPKPIDLRGTTTRMRARIVGNGY